MPAETKRRVRRRSHKLPTLPELSDLKGQLNPIWIASPTRSDLAESALQVCDK